MTDLAEFLLARIAEDEGYAARWRSVADSVGDVYGNPYPPREDLNAADRAYFALHKAADWVLAECEAKRQIVDIYEGAARAENMISGLPASEERAPGLAVASSAKVTAYGALQCLALPYADHPDYRPEWRPSA
jgi:hypothetical protein